MKDLLSVLPEIGDVTTGEKIRAYRKAFNISQMQLCEILGISQNNLSAIENNRRSIALSSAIKFSAVFNVDPIDLIYPNGVDQSSEWIEVKKRMA